MYHCRLPSSRWSGIRSSCSSVTEMTSTCTYEWVLSFSQPSSCNNRLMNKSKIIYQFSFDARLLSSKFLRANMEWLLMRHSVSTSSMRAFNHWWVIVLFFSLFSPSNRVDGWSLRIDSGKRIFILFQPIPDAPVGSFPARIKVYYRRLSVCRVTKIFLSIISCRRWTTPSRR